MFAARESIVRSQIIARPAGTLSGRGCFIWMELGRRRGGPRPRAFVPDTCFYPASLNNAIHAEMVKREATVVPMTIAAASCSSPFISCAMIALTTAVGVA